MTATAQPETIYLVYQEIDPNSTPCEWWQIFSGTEREVYAYLLRAHRPQDASFYGRRLKVVAPDGTEETSGDWVYDHTTPWG